MQETANILDTIKEVQKVSLRMNDDSREMLHLLSTAQNTLARYLESLNKMSESEFNNLYSKEDAIQLGYIIENMKLSVHNNLLHEPINKRLSSNNIQSDNNSFNIRKLDNNNASGELTGETAIARFTTLLGTGSIVQIPLWHSGFWITIRPPKCTRLIGLTAAIRARDVELGINTSNLIYSNHSVVTTNLLLEFIIEHMVSTSVNLGDTDIRKLISTQDLYPLVLGLLTSMYPEGIDVRQVCRNSIVDPKSKDSKEVCDFVAEAKLDTTRLLWVDKTKLKPSMIELMVNKIPNSTTIEQVLEYQELLGVHTGKSIDLVSDNGTNISMTLKVPTLEEYINNGERWVESVSAITKSLYVKTDTKEMKLNTVNSVVNTCVLGIYNGFVVQIKHGEGTIVKDRASIDELLELFSSDDMMIKNYIKQIESYIDSTAIAIVATQAYTCPKCKTPQTGKTTSEPFTAEFLPLEVLEAFFHLSSLRIAKSNAK